MRRESSRPGRVIAALAVLTCLGLPISLFAQSTGTVEGRVTHAGTGTPLPGIMVAIGGTRLVAATDAQGRYTLGSVPAGTQTVLFRWLGFGGRELQAKVTAGSRVAVDAELEPIPLRLGEIVVSTVSRQPERVLDAPAAISGVEAARIRDMAIAGQAPMLLSGQPGVQLVQSGTNDFNVNARGFNGPLNRRVLVLVDGRDVSVPISGSMEWPAVSVDEEATRIEFVRGPASALYGANAFNGVLDIVTPSVRESQGTRLMIAGGEWSSANIAGRYGVVSNDQRWGWRTNASYYTTNGFDRSRTELGHLSREYEGAIDTGKYPVKVPVPGYELRALNGQTKEGAFGLPGRASGDADPLRNMHASTRVDRYFDNGSELTAEGGISHTGNQVWITTTGRSQAKEATRPWARLAYSSNNMDVHAWYSGRSGSTYGLNSGALADESSGTLHLEAQTKRRFAGDRGRLVLGASTRQQTLDSKGTLFAPRHDGRSDGYHAIFGQADFEIAPKLKVVFAGRVDEGSLIDRQFSPKGALVYSPTKNQSVRVTVDRSYLTPTALERFIRFPAAPPLDLRALEGGLRASPLGPALGGVPVGTLFTNSAVVPLLILGNETLEPQRQKGFELGYKGQWGDDLFLAANMWRSDIRDFITGAFPGVQPPYRSWTAPTAVPEVARAALEGAVRSAIGPGLTRLEDGTTVFGVSLSTAGRVVERGGDVAAGVRLTRDLRVDANYGYYDVEIKQSTFLPADSILPNTPSHAGNVGATWMRGEGVRVQANIALVSAFDWRTGFYRGRVPARQSVDLTASYPLSRQVRLSLVGTNILDQKRYQLFGGSVVRRRVMVGATWTR